MVIIFLQEIIPQTSEILYLEKKLMTKITFHGWNAMHQISNKTMCQCNHWLWMCSWWPIPVIMNEVFTVSRSRQKMKCSNIPFPFYQFIEFFMAHYGSSTRCEWDPHMNRLSHPVGWDTHIYGVIILAVCNGLDSYIQIHTERVSRQLSSGSQALRYHSCAHWVQGHHVSDH